MRRTDFEYHLPEELIAQVPIKDRTAARLLVLDRGTSQTVHTRFNKLHEFLKAGDVVTLTFANGKKCVVNTQRPTRQIWLAANARAWHFSYEEASGKWLDDKGQNVELLAQVAAIVKEHANVDLTIR